MTPRRQLALVVLACAVGAVLALVAAGRPWEVAVTPRPAPLPDLRSVHTGGDRWPWLPALGWVGLAGAGALVATRGAARRVVGGLLGLAGAGLAVAGGGVALGLAGTGADRAAGGWPALAGLAGLLVAGAGAVAVAGGRRWPAMGARYQRAGRSARRGSGGGPPGTGSEDRPSAPEAAAGSRPELLWEALDRGEDPTDR